MFGFIVFLLMVGCWKVSLAIEAEKLHAQVLLKYQSIFMIDYLIKLSDLNLN